MTFDELKLSEPLLKAVADAGYNEPTPIQQQSIPIVLGGNDLMGCAQTGTGKTAAFALPILQLLTSRSQEGKKKKIRSLIVTPTRELAIQIDDNFKLYGKYLGLRSTVIFGGVKQNAQVSSLRGGVDVLVATPGRLLDLINQRIFDLYSIEIFVLDEADRMLDMGFIHDVRKIISLLPKERQSLFFSATMPEPIIKLASSILHNPLKVEVTPSATTAETVNQSIYFVDKSNKVKLLVDILNNEDIPSVLVFTRTKHGADRVAQVLNKNKIKAEAIHGNKSQNARQNALAHFKEQSTRVLVATDIAARGIDVENLEYVINYDLPNIPESYVHRIGRTGRAGANGTAYSFCDMEERPYLKDIEKLIKQKISVIENHPFPPTESESDVDLTFKKREQRPHRPSRRSAFRNDDKSEREEQTESRETKRPFRKTDKRKTAIRKEQEGDAENREERQSRSRSRYRNAKPKSEREEAEGQTEFEQKPTFKARKVERAPETDVAEEKKAPKARTAKVQAQAQPAVQPKTKSNKPKSKKQFVPREHNELESNASFDEIEFRSSSVPHSNKPDNKKWFEFWKKH